MEKLYRKGVIAVIIDQDNNFLIVQLNGYGGNDWNFVGGGREGGESALENLEREIKEELNLDPSDYEIIGKSKGQLKYDFPTKILKEGTAYSGQIKDQFVVRLLAEKEKIKIQEDEIREYKWVSFAKLQKHLRFPNQYSNFLEVVAEIIPSVLKD